MADYLAGVVARAMGAAETVRPRVPSLFEPTGFGAADGAATDPPAPGDGAARPEERMERESRRERPVSDAPLTGERSAPQRAEQSVAHAVQTTIETRMERVVQPELPLLAPVSPRGDSASVASPPPTARPRPAAPDAPLPGPSKDAPSAAPVQVTKRSQESRVAPEPPDVQQRLRSIAKELLLRDGVSPSPAHDSRSHRPPVMVSDLGAQSRRPRDTGMAEAALVVRPVPAEASGETLVHVSIGRVEVSAPAAPPQPTPARRRPKPPTPLNEYLGRRNGTRR
jgi:hypothetical protein